LYISTSVPSVTSVVEFSTVQMSSSPEKK
jgi:hypothetical protein